MENMDVMRALFPGLQSISFIIMQCVLYGVDADGPEKGQENVLLVKLGGLKNMATNLMFVGFILWLSLGFFQEQIGAMEVILLIIVCAVASIGTLLSMTGIILYLKNRKSLLK